MKVAWIVFLLAAVCSGRVVEGKEPPDHVGRVHVDYVIKPIVSLDDVQGDWAISPTYSQGSSKPLLLVVKGKDGIYKHIKFADKKVGLEVTDGALILKTDAPYIMMKRWNLVQYGDYKYLIYLGALATPGTHPSLNPYVLYLNPTFESHSPNSN
jgi:hypothetical protein